MKMIKILYIFIIIASMALTGCRGTREVVVNTDNSSLQSKPVLVHGVGDQVYALPKAVIYRTNGDYDNKVIVLFDRKSGQLVGYPAPTDITADSAPLQLGDGWLLDRRGAVGPNSVFLSYTYDEYASLSKVPTMSELLDHIIPEAAVTEYMQLPVTLNTALADPAGIIRYIPKK